MQLRWLACAVVALTAACASVSPPERSYAGRFSATTVLAAERQNLSGRFSLEIRGGQKTLDLATPIGTTLARVEINEDGARVIGQAQVIRGPDADALTEQMLGWRLPVNGLADWIEGRPAPGRPARVERNETGISLIEQDGWTIRISEFFASESRPRRLSLERPTAGTRPAVSVRLILDDPAS